MQGLTSGMQTCDAVGELLKVTVPELVDGLAAFSDGQHNIPAIVGNLEEEVGSRYLGGRYDLYHDS